MEQGTIEKVAKSYIKLLSSIDWDDDVLIAGLTEGLNKFLSNAFLRLHPDKKYLQGNFYSVRAASKIKAGEIAGLIYEHMVPKGKYIQKVCEEKAAHGDLNLEFVVDILRRYWRIAVITKEEDSLLLSRQMPKDWDEIDIFYRYRNKGISLISNPFVSKDELWGKLERFINTIDGGTIRHTNGEIGEIRFENGSLVIQAKELIYKYPPHSDLTAMFYDGWYFE